MCGRVHTLRNVAAGELVIQAFIDGELQTVTDTGIVTLCIMDVLRPGDELKAA